MVNANQIILDASIAISTAAVGIPTFMGIKGLTRKDETKCQTVGEYLSQVFRGETPDYARIRTEQTRQRIMGKMAQRG